MEYLANLGTMENQRELIERVDWEYSLYKNDDVYELMTYLAEPQPGFDVSHTLTEEEISAYLVQGIAVLQVRLSDMRANFTRYPHNPWR